MRKGSRSGVRNGIFKLGFIGVNIVYTFENFWCSVSICNDISGSIQFTVTQNIMGIAVYKFNNIGVF